MASFALLNIDIPLLLSLTKQLVTTALQGCVEPLGICASLRIAA